MTHLARFYFIILAAAALLGLAASAAAPAEAAAPAVDSTTAADAVVLCLPGVYSEAPEDCQPLGPSQTLSSLADQGLHMPLEPLPAVPGNPALRQTPYAYAQINADETTPVYTNLNDARAMANPARTIAKGDLIYISYVDVAYNEDGSAAFYYLREGGWIPASAVTSRVWSTTNAFQGLTFGSTPEREFGWMLPFDYSFKPKRTPGHATRDYSTRQLYPYDVVQIYSTTVVDNYTWYMVGPNEWLEARFIGKVTPSDTPPAGVSGSRWIDVNLFEQTLAVYDGGQMVFATLIATGQEPFYTRPGVFQVYEKLDVTHMSGAFTADRSDYYHLQDVPWTLYYDKARALHAAYWRTRFGYPQSHGCINLAPGDANWLYTWAQVGDWVYVHDPSGKTPTDPAKYGDGGA